jgi:hypothetical protein
MKAMPAVSLKGLEAPRREAACAFFGGDLKSSGSSSLPRYG